MTVINLTCGRSTWPVRDPIVEGYRQLFAAVLVRAARDLKSGYVSQPEEGSAYEFLSMPEARHLAEVVGLLGGEGGR